MHRVTQVSWFRGLLIAQVSSLLLAAILDGPIVEVGSEWSTLPGSKAIEKWSSLWIEAIIGLALVVAGIASWVGLFRFRRWARMLALVSTVGVLIRIMDSGLESVYGLSGMLQTLSELCWGSSLTKAFFSDIRTQFK